MYELHLIMELTALNGSDENPDDTHLMRMAGRFSRRLRAAVADRSARPS